MSENESKYKRDVESYKLLLKINSGRKEDVFDISAFFHTTRRRVYL